MSYSGRPGWDRPAGCGRAFLRARPARSTPRPTASTSIGSRRSAHVSQGPWVDHFAAIGGVPLLAVFDRAKTVALEWDRTRQVTEWNPLLAGVALDLSVGIDVCWPAAPWQHRPIRGF